VLAAVGVAALVVTLALALPRHERRPKALSLAPPSRLGPFLPAPPAGAAGPEQVPIPAAPALAPPRALRPGERIDGIGCQTSEQVAFHVHARLRIVVRGRSRQVPAGIGIAAPYQVEATPSGAFVAGGTCLMWLHTHAADGIVHIESPIDRTYTLGDFFDVWGQPLMRGRVGPAHGRVTALLDDRVFTGDPRTIPLLAQARSSSRWGVRSSPLNTSRSRAVCEDETEPVKERLRPGVGPERDGLHPRAGGSADIGQTDGDTGVVDHRAADPGLRMGGQGSNCDLRD